MYFCVLYFYKTHCLCTVYAHWIQAGPYLLDQERLKDEDGDDVDDDEEDDSVTLVVDGGVESRIDVSATQGREQHSPTAERS